MLSDSGGLSRFARGTPDSSQGRPDRYGRFLAYITGDDRRLLQADLLGLGWAKVYVFERRFKRYREFVAIQNRARLRRRGVWGRCGGNFHRPAP